MIVLFVARPKPVRTKSRGSFDSSNAFDTCGPIGTSESRERDIERDRDGGDRTNETRREVGRERAEWRPYVMVTSRERETVHRV